MDTWQPIETAPKDGTKILICKNSFVDTAHWEESPGWACKEEGACWALVMADDDYYSIYLPKEYFSHWMPLPKAPE